MTFVVNWRYTNKDGLTGWICGCSLVCVWSSLSPEEFITATHVVSSHCVCPVWLGGWDQWHRRSLHGEPAPSGRSLLLMATNWKSSAAASGSVCRASEEKHNQENKYLQPALCWFVFCESERFVICVNFFYSFSSTQTLKPQPEVQVVVIDDNSLMPFSDILASFLGGSLDHLNFPDASESTESDVLQASDLMTSNPLSCKEEWPALH